MLPQGLNIRRAHQALKDRDFSATDLTKLYLKEIEQKNKELNALLAVFENEALGQAAIIDKRIKQHLFGKNVLEGIPIIIKDNILLQDFPCTAGSKILKNYIASYDATAIKRLKEAGTIFLGKSNLDEFAMGASNENSAFGLVKNPHDLTRVPGGSSGGSAAAVAAKMCLAALGSDTGGSVRQPASFCGVVGLKPTYGRVSRYGLIAMASSLDQIGVLANTVDDAAMLLSGIEGVDNQDMTSVNYDFSTELPRTMDWQNIKIGLAQEFFSHGLDKNIKEQIDKLINRLEHEGAKIVEVKLSNLDYALASYYILMPAEVSANLARYDGIKYGLSVKGDSLLDTYLNSRTRGFGDEVRRRIILGTFILSAGYYEAYYLKAKKVRDLVKYDFMKAFEKVDCLLTPTTPTPAFKIGEKINDPLQMYLSDIYTVPVNLAGLPAISIPIGKVNDLPIGCQLIGNHWQENKILSIAKNIEQLSTQ